MNITISLYELGGLILFLLAVGVGIYLAVTLKNLNGLIRRINGLVEENSEEFTATVAALPEISRNLSQASNGLRKSMEQAESAVETIAGNVNETAVVVGRTADQITTYAVVAAEVVKAVAEIFSRSNDRG